MLNDYSTLVTHSISSDHDEQFLKNYPKYFHQETTAVSLVLSFRSWPLSWDWAWGEIHEKMSLLGHSEHQQHKDDGTPPACKKGCNHIQRSHFPVKPHLKQALILLSDWAPYLPVAPQLIQQCEILKEIRAVQSSWPVALHLRPPTD